MYKPEWREEDMQRLLNMERWYILDGRHLKTNKFHGVYTGLAKIGPALDRKEGLTNRMTKAYERRNH